MKAVMSSCLSARDTEPSATWQTLARTVHLHPTFAEGLQILATQLEGE
jgi:hypothetical protein